MSQKGLYDPILWALRAEAAKALDELVKLGWDRDLALVTLEAAVGAESLYDLPLEESEGEDAG